jgi:hypothetical protein
MLSAIRIIFLSWVMSLLLVTSSIAGTILYGTVRLNPHVYFSGQSVIHEIFPDRLYGFYLHAYDLKYTGSVKFQDRVKELDQFTLSINADLNLTSFDKTTGFTKFKLTLKSFNSLSYLGKTNSLLMFTGGAPLKEKSSLKLADGSEPEFIIEGQMKMVNGKATWISFNRNRYFDIDVEYFDNYVLKQKYYIVTLKLLHDFPVIVVT